MAQNSPRLTMHQRRFVAALLSARTIEEAAHAAGVKRRTATRYLALDSVRAALAQALDQAEAQAVRVSVSAMTEAVGTLRAIHADKDAPTGARVSAARAILEAGPRLREILDLAERVTELEQNMGEE